MKRIFSTLIALLCVIGASAFRTDTVTVASEYLATPMKVTVITPDGNADARFPSVYLLNGYDGDYRQWTKQTAPGILGPLADLYGMVLVMPSGRDSWYWDAPNDPGMQMESFITKALVPYIDENFPTINKNSKRAITGLSMGGHGAIWLAGRHPELFRSMGSMSGCMDVAAFGGKWNIGKIIGDYSTNPEVWKEHSVVSLLPRLKMNGQNIIFDCGTADFFARVNDKFHQSMVRLQIPHDYTSRPGGHTHAYWANSIKHHLLFFDAVFKDIKTK